MSVRAITWAFEQDIAPTEKVVLLSLADYCNEHGRCWPSIGRLVERARVSERTVQRALNELEAAGYIVREERSGDDGRSRSNLYRLTFMGEGVKLTPRGDTGDGGEGVMGDGGEGDTGVTPLKGTTIKNPKKEPSLSADAEEADFEEFWAAYPKRPNNPKQPAKAKYLHARRRLLASHETLLNSVKQYAASRMGQDPTYTAMAATWLNQRRWEEYDGDDPVPVAHGSTDIIDLVREISGHYPGIIDSGTTAEVSALIRNGVKPGDLAEAAEKYKLWVKFQRSEGVNLTVPTLSVWLKFRWRDMSNYVFCYRGMTNKKSVKLRKGSGDEVSA